MKASYPLQVTHCQVTYLSCHAMHREHFFPTESLNPQTKFILYSDHRTLVVYSIAVSKLLPEPEIVNSECVCRTS
jgi:hypothetical protein